MKEIILSGGQRTQVSDEDWTWLNKQSWFLTEGGYVRGRVEKNLIYMHRAIASAIGLDCAHDISFKDKNPLNNQRNNIRASTDAQTTWTKIVGRSLSGKKGVTWNSKREKWHSRITVHGKRIHLGWFDDKEKAHTTYCEAAKHHFGEFANVN